MKESTNIFGYSYGTDAVSRSPVNFDDFELRASCLMMRT